MNIRVLSRRTDLENVPRDGSDVWCEFEEYGLSLQIVAGWSNDHHAWFDNWGRSYPDELLVAWRKLEEVKMRKNGKTLTQAKAFATTMGWPWPEDDDLTPEELEAFYEQPRPGD